MHKEVALKNLVLSPMQQNVYSAVLTSIRNLNEALHQKAIKTAIKKIHPDFLEAFFCDFSGDVKKKAYKGFITFKEFIFYSDLYIQKSQEHIAKDAVLERKVKELLKKRENSIRKIDIVCNGDEYKISELYAHMRKNGLSAALLVDGSPFFNEEEDYVICEIGFEAFFSDNSEKHDYAINSTILGHFTFYAMHNFYNFNTKLLN